MSLPMCSWVGRVPAVSFLGMSCTFFVANKIGLSLAGPYKDTVNLPQTKFNMRANSVQREPEIHKMWEKLDVYQELLQTNTGVSTSNIYFVCSRSKTGPTCLISVLSSMLLCRTYIHCMMALLMQTGRCSMCLLRLVLTVLAH